MHVLYFTLNIKKLIFHHFHKYWNIISVFFGSWTKQPPKIAQNSSASQPWSASAQGLHGRKDPSWAHAPYDQWRLLVPQGSAVSGAWWVSSFQFHPPQKICNHQSGSLKTPISEMEGENSKSLSCHRFSDGIRKPRLSETWKPARDGVFGGGWQDGEPKKNNLWHFHPGKENEHPPFTVSFWSVS